MATPDINNRTLWRIPRQGMIKGVCAGIAQYLNIPVKLVRVLVVLSMFFGLALVTLLAYIVLTFLLDPMPDNLAESETTPSSTKLLDRIERQLQQKEKCLRAMERYITSDAFTQRRRFRPL